MQKEWNKLLLFAIAIGFKNLMKAYQPDGKLAEEYSAAVKAYKKELGLG